MSWMTKGTLVLLLLGAPFPVYSQDIITTVAGNGAHGFSGDGGPATSASLSGPAGVALDGGGSLYIADSINDRIRKVSPAGIISTVAGNGGRGFSGDRGPATSASLYIPIGVAVDAAGNLYISDSWNYRIRKVSPAGIISTVAGNGFRGFSGDGGPATSGSLDFQICEGTAGQVVCRPISSGPAVDGAGNLYIADTGNHRIRKVSPNGIISTVAGNGVQGFSGDGGPATSASLYWPTGVAVDTAGNLYIADLGNHRIRKVSPGGIISTAAGNGVRGFSGDGGPAPGTSLYWPIGIGVDAARNLYIADWANHRIRKVSPGGIISTVAGNGVRGFSGDGGPAPSASLSSPQSAVVDAAGNLYIADSSNDRIRKVEPAPELTPQISAGVLNAASFLPLPVCAGSLVSIFGTGLASGTGGATTLPLPTNLNGAEVRISGFLAPLVFVSPTQINLQIPWEVSGQSLSVQVIVEGRASNTVTIPSAPVCGGVFTTSSTGRGQGAILIAGTGEVAASVGSIEGGAARAVRPGEFITIYATGLGPVTNPPRSGSAASANPLSEVVTPVLCTIGVVVAEVVFAGLSPGFVGLYQINVRVPEGAPTGDAVEVVCSSGGVTWNTVTIALLPQNTAELIVFKIGSGTVTISWAGINCYTTCRAVYPTGTVETLTATPASGWTFTRWEGACQGTVLSCTLTMQPDLQSLFGDKMVKAVFTEAPTQTFTLTVSKAGTGSGTVTSSPPGINCGVTCSAAFSRGTSVTLTATAASGSTLGGWSGACLGTGSCVVTVNSDTFVTATFHAAITAAIRPTSVTCSTVASTFGPLLVINASGQASGPVESFTQADLQVAATGRPLGGLNFRTCTGWSRTREFAGYDVCKRASGQPEQTDWTISHNTLEFPSSSLRDLEVVFGVWIHPPNQPNVANQLATVTVPVTCPTR